MKTLVLLRSVVEPFAHLPDEITLSRDEVERLLEALDLGMAASDQRTGHWIAQRSAQTMLIAKLWPDLGVLLEDSDGDGDSL